METSGVVCMTNIEFDYFTEYMYSCMYIGGGFEFFFNKHLK